MTYRRGFVVPELKAPAIFEFAGKMRTLLSKVVGDGPLFPIERVYEVLPDLIEGFRFEVLTPDEFGPEHGLTYPARKLIQLREDVYDGMCKGNGRDRVTGAHELGHLFLHADIGLARVLVHELDAVPNNRNSEWQADLFAIALLVDTKTAAESSSAEDLASKCGVLVPVAAVRLEAFKKLNR